MRPSLQAGPATICCCSPGTITRFGGKTSRATTSVSVAVASAAQGSAAPPAHVLTDRL